MSEHGHAVIREAVGVFDEAPALEAAIDELESAGFDRAEISLLAGEGAVSEKLGHKYRKIGELADDPKTPRTAFVSTESIGDAEGAVMGALLYVSAVAAAGAVVASGGTLIPAIAAAAVAGGGGAAAGGIFARMIGKHHADYLQKQLDRGGLLLWVRTRNTDHEARASKILRRHSAHDVHVHDLPASSGQSERRGDMTDEATKARVEKALLDPSAVFREPEDVVAAAEISVGQRIEILRRWAYDVREQEVAQEENMPGSPRFPLSRLLKALHALGAAPDLEHAPPTKQGG